MPSPSVLPEALGSILLVDDESELVEAVSSMLRIEFGEARVKATDSPKLAASWIDQERPGVLITDLRMPEYTGLNLLERCQQLWGPTPTILITAHPTENIAKGARRGHYTYLPKPFSFHSLVEIIHQLEAAPPSSFQGAIHFSNLTDLMQLYAISNRTGHLAVKSGQHRGEVFFDQGQIVHAETQSQQGFDAFCAILQWPRGSFAWYPRRTEERTIQMSVSELMLEAYRIQDELANEHLSSLPPSQPETQAQEKPEKPPTSIPSELLRLQHIEGFLAAGLIDLNHGIDCAIGDTGPTILEEALSNIGFINQKRALLKKLEIQDDIEEILLTLGKQYRLIRPIRVRPNMFFYLVLDRARSNLALARLTLARIEHEIGA